MIALLELLEAEGRSLKQNFFRAGVGIAFTTIAALIALGGVFMCLWAGYQYLSILLGPILAAASAGLVMLIIASVLMWTAFKLSR